jgi:hypothetical protein
MNAKQALYSLNHTSTPFSSGYFGDGVLGAIFPGLALNYDPPDLSLSIFSSSITGMSHQHLARGYILWEIVS